jgi:hypothetical protein
MAAVVEQIEIRSAILPANHDLAIDRRRARLEPSERLDDEPEAARPVEAPTGVEPHALAVAPDYHRPLYG